MSRLTKILLGIATAWPFIYIIFFVLFIFLTILLGPGGGDGFPALLALIIPLHLLTILLIIGLQIFYLVNVFRNERVRKDHQVIWVIALFLGGLFAMPVYWYMNIWREVEAGTEQTALGSGEGFEPAQTSASETRTGEPVQPEPHSWR